MCEFHKQRGIMESNENAVGWLLRPKIETMRIIIKMWRFGSTIPAKQLRKPLCAAYGHNSTSQIAEYQIYAHNICINMHTHRRHIHLMINLQQPT